MNEMRMKQFFCMVLAMVTMPNIHSITFMVKALMAILLENSRAMMVIRHILLRIKESFPERLIRLSGLVMIGEIQH